MANLNGDEPLIPLADLTSGIVVLGPGGKRLSLSDPRCDEIGIRRCDGCRLVKLLTEFGDYQGRLHARHTCMECMGDAHRWGRENGSDKSHATNLRLRHITAAEYEELFASQGGLCAICRKECRSGTRLCLDHDHACCPGAFRSCGKCNRGLLCQDCNRALGLFHDDLNVLLNAAEYLQRYSSCANQ